MRYECIDKISKWIWIGNWQMLPKHLAQCAMHAKFPNTIKHYTIEFNIHFLHLYLLLSDHRKKRFSISNMYIHPFRFRLDEISNILNAHLFYSWKCYLIIWEFGFIFSICSFVLFPKFRWFWHLIQLQKIIALTLETI